jgi:DNA helicase-2/ATP-dependent DNA helicase PcrA
VTESERTPEFLADLLGLDPPTTQQSAVIQAPIDSPSLVVAGAGSGKTETMAGRVIWLLANGHAVPSQVLGLTFTRKAAGELAKRMRERIAQLVATGLVGADWDELEQPQIATYNSYANRLYRDNASVLGREADGAVLGEAAAWQLARTIVTKSADARLLEQDRSLDQITESVLGLSRAIADNVAQPGQIKEFARSFGETVDLPLGGKAEYPPLLDAIAAVGELDLLVDLAAEYDEAKLRRGFVEYSDQVALALEILKRSPSVIDEQRAENKYVLLDEYQDTSVTQAWLLSRLYSGHPVMAVGDPNQSIYGWRGASASNLAEFPAQFGPGPHYSLSMSWRNGRRILDVANRLVEPLRTTAGVSVEELEPKNKATEFPVGTVFRQSVLDEAKSVALWLKERLDGPGGPHTAALLMRARKNQPIFLAALREAKVRYHVLGVGGLLAEPEVADVVSALSVVHSVDAGMELVRLLAGSRWRIGVNDLNELANLSSILKTRGIDNRALDPEVSKVMRNSIAQGERGSIIDALDYLSWAKEDRDEWNAFSTEGRVRLRDAGKALARLRTLSSLDLPDFVSAVVHELRLDIEVAANRFRTLGSAPIEALFDALTGYLAIDDSASLGGFLSWLREAEKREDLAPRPEDAEDGVVQVLTIHGAKGLEWDIVAVPRLVEDELPSASQGLSGWMRFGQLPWEFRGDSRDLPLLPWRSADTRKALNDMVGEFREAVRTHERAEERRLAYVAVTRARHHLLLSGSYWSAIKKARVPSAFLTELAEVGLAPNLSPEPDGPNPMGDNIAYVSWPFDPLGDRRAEVEEAAAAVEGATPEVHGPWSTEVDALLAEREARLAGRHTIPVPSRVSASRFKDFLHKTDDVASSLRRPMPERPFRATQLGTLFHSWVENRYGPTAPSDELDSLASESDGEFFAVDLERLEQLKHTFESSPWAKLRPIEVEREIHLPFDGRVIICKIDAIFQTPGADGVERYQIVDWKTGKVPDETDPSDIEQRGLQLALYRLAYSKWSGVPIDKIDAVLYFVSENRVIEPPHIDDERELLAKWRAVFA